MAGLQSNLTPEQIEEDIARHLPAEQVQIRKLQLDIQDSGIIKELKDLYATKFSEANDFIKAILRSLLDSCLLPSPNLRAYSDASDELVFAALFSLETSFSNESFPDYLSELTQDPEIKLIRKKMSAVFQKTSTDLSRPATPFAGAGATVTAGAADDGHTPGTGPA